MTDSQEWWVLGNAVLYSFIQKFATVRFFECAANSAIGEIGGGGGKTSRSRGETGDIIFTEWNLRFIQNVASCYVLCLTIESVINATLVNAPVCVCVPRAPHGVIRVRLKYQVEAGPDWIPSRSGSGLESGLWEALVYNIKGTYDCNATKKISNLKK